MSSGLKTRIGTALRENAFLQSTMGRVVLHMPASRPAIMVASFGRAGSTLVWKSLNSAMCRARLGRLAPVFPGACARSAFGATLDTQLRAGIVYKTHAYPDILSHNRETRTVFLFGSATDAALSVYEQKALRGEAWVRQHFEHLRRPYRYNDLLDEDVLGMRDQCIQWMGHTASPVLCVRFEALWDIKDKLSQFCELDVWLPTRTPRKEKEISTAQRNRAQATYGPLDAQLERLPDCFEAAPEHAAHLQKA